MAGFLVTLAAFRWLIPFARRIGYVDRPGGRKQHIGHTPLIGGVIVIPVSICLIWAVGLFNREMAILFTGVLAIFLMGAYDDLRQVRPWAKFFIQLIVATYLVIIGGAEVRVLGNIWGVGEVGLNIFSIPFSIASLVLLMNAINMMDGLDGLAGGMVAVLLAWLVFAAWTTGHVEIAMQITCILVPLLAFLCFNMRHPFLKKARVFLGDAGALSLAVLAGWFAITLSQPPVSAIAPAGIMWLLAIPVIDTLTLFFIRILRGRHPFSPDRNHLHHRFLDKGLPVHWTTLFVLLSAVGCGVVGVQGPAVGIPEYVLFAGWWIVLASYIAYSLRPGADRRF